MPTHTYEVPKGDNVLAKHVGAKITLNEPEIVDGPNPFVNFIPKYFADAQALGASALRDRRIMANRKVRAVLSTEEGTVAKAIEEGNKVVVGAPRVAGPAKPKSPKAQARAVAASAGNAALDKCIADPARAKAAIDAGLFSAEEIESYRKWKNTPEPTKAPATPAAATPAEAQAPASTKPASGTSTRRPATAGK